MRGLTRNRGVFASAAVVLAAGLGLAGAQAVGASAAPPAAAPPAAVPAKVALAAPAAAVRGGLVVDGVTGEGTAIAGGIDVVDFSDAVKAVVATGGGGGAGKPQLADLQVTGVLDAAYPVLFRNITTGRHMRAVELTACADPKRCAATANLEIDLGDAVLTQVAVAADGQVRLSFAFRQITWKFLRNGAVVTESTFSQ